MRWRLIGGFTCWSWRMGCRLTWRLSRGLHRRFAGWLTSRKTRRTHHRLWCRLPCWLWCRLSSWLSRRLTCRLPRRLSSRHWTTICTKIHHCHRWASGICWNMSDIYVVLTCCYRGTSRRITRIIRSTIIRFRLTKDNRGTSWSGASPFIWCWCINCYCWWIWINSTTCIFKFISVKATTAIRYDDRQRWC